MTGWGWFNSKGWHACAADLYAVRRTLGPAVSVESQYSADPLGTSTCRYTFRLPVVDLCDAEELDNGLKPCGRTLCVHGRCRKHGGCDRCDDVVDASAFALAADEGARMSRIYGGAAALFGKSEAIRQLIDQHDGPVMVTGVDPATGMGSTISVPVMLRPARVIEGARVMVIVGGQHLRFFEGIDLSQMAERRLPPLDWDPAEREPVRITLTRTLPGRIDRITANVRVDDVAPPGHPNAAVPWDPTTGRQPTAYGWCFPLTRPTTIASPIPRPVVPSPWLVVRRAGKQGKGTPKGWGTGKGAYRHGVGSRRDIARMKRQSLVRAIVARIARGAGMFQVNHALV